MTIPPIRHPGRSSLAVVLLLGALAAGCTANDPAPSVGAAPRGSVAFDSIDGLPPGHFDKLVQDMAWEAESRQLAVVSREGPAQYRVRGYASATVAGKRTTIAWVWDVYDAAQNRAVRLAGEAQGRPGLRGWSAADDPTLQRIAHDGMTQLADFLGGRMTPPPAEPEPAAPESGPAVAALESPVPAAAFAAADAGR